MKTQLERLLKNVKDVCLHEGPSLIVKVRGMTQGVQGLKSLGLVQVDFNYLELSYINQLLK